MANSIDDPDPDDPWNYHRCKCCGYKTRFLSSILTHVRLHRRRSKNDLFLCHTHPPQEYQCEKCPFLSHFKVYYTMHFNIFHKAEETQHSVRPVLNCENCDFRTYSSLILLNHNCRDITDKSPRTSQKWNFEPKDEEDAPSQHIEKRQVTLKKLKPFKCHHCHFNTTSKPSLKIHVLLKHTPPEHIKWHNCEHCPYKAKMKRSLIEHVLSRHTDPAELEKLKRFKCDYCSYRTRKKALLKSHVIYKHTPSYLINWLKCEYCAYKAKVKVMLYQHMRAHHKGFERNRFNN